MISIEQKLIEISLLFLNLVIKIELKDEEYVLPAEDLEKLNSLRLSSKDNEALDLVQETNPKLGNCDCTELKELEQNGKATLLKSEINGINGIVDENSKYNLYLVQKEINNSFPTVFVITPTYFR